MPASEVMGDASRPQTMAMTIGRLHDWRGGPHAIMDHAPRELRPQDGSPSFSGQKTWRKTRFFFKAG